MQRIIVIENPNEWVEIIDGVEIISPSAYINEKQYATQRKIKVINLCKSYHYQSEGYYISLLAEARGHKSLPVTSTLLDFKLPNLAREDAEDFDNLIQEVLNKSTHEDRLELMIYFGFTKDPLLSKIGQLLFNLFQTPIQRVLFMKKKKWQLQSLKPLNLPDLTAIEKKEMSTSLQLFLSGKKIVNKTFKRKKYDLAILVDPGDSKPPSDARALQKFVKAADKIGFNTEFITRADYGKITHFDALFIRETTNVNHHTFRFARKAEYEGLSVIDDSQSILKCTNKVYLNELLGSYKIPTPISINLRKNELEKLDQLTYPFILKQPDGSFSKGVKKVKDKKELDYWLKEYFQKTDLLIAQEYMPTSFDWRIGVLGGKVLFVCKYLMARNHWQIIDWRASGASREGGSETIPINKAPKNLLALAIKASNLIGDGLYGVDIKEQDGKFYVIEINDNPTIDSGVEDKAESVNIYETIMEHMMDKVLSN